MITWKHPEQLTKTTFKTHPVNLPFLGGRVEVVNTDAVTGARLERPEIHLHAEAVDCDWHLVLQGTEGTQAAPELMPENVRAMDKDFCLVFADGRRFELLRQKREPIADAAQAARELRLARNRGRAVAPTAAPTATAKGGKTRDPVTLEEAAAIVGRTSRTVQNWENGKVTRPEGYPGRGDPVELGAWVSRRKRQADTRRAVANVVRVGDVDRFSRPDKQHNEWQNEMKRRAAPLKQDDADED